MCHLTSNSVYMCISVLYSDLLPLVDYVLLYVGVLSRFDSMSVFRLSVALNVIR